MADLVTVAELASYLKQDVDTSSATLAIKGAQKAVRRYTGQEFTTATWTSVRLPVRWLDGIGYVVRLPQRPVTSVSSVTVNGGGASYNLDTLNARLIITSSIPAAPEGVTDQAVVTYSSGTAVADDDVKLVTLSVAARIYDNPSGVRSWTINDEGSETKAGADEDLAGVSLLPAEKLLLDDFRFDRKFGSLRLT